MKRLKNVFKPHNAKHSHIESEFKVMCQQTMAKRRREMNRKNFPSEAWFDSMLRKEGVRGYRRNVPIASRFFGDFVWRRERLVVEIDGKSHDGKEGYDSRRDALIESLGVKVIRVKMGDTERALWTVQFIKDVIAGRNK